MTLRQIREAQGLRREYVAALCGCSCASVEGWEAGRVIPGFGKAVMLAKTYSIDLEALWQAICETKGEAEA